MRPIVNDLRKQLESLNQVQSLSAESKVVSEKEVIQDFIRKCCASGVSNEDTKTELGKVYKEVLISGDVFEWGVEKAIMMDRGGESQDLSKAISIATEAEKNTLICQDTIYHASLCNLAVCTRNSATYKQFFEADYPLHTIKAASISIPKENHVDKYLIARQGSVYYVAFRSEPLLSEWSKHFHSFIEGIYM